MNLKRRIKTREILQLTDAYFYQLQNRINTRRFSTSKYSSSNPRESFSLICIADILWKREKLTAVVMAMWITLRMHELLT